MEEQDTIFVEDIVASYGDRTERPGRRGGKYEVLYCPEGAAADQYFCIYPTDVIVMGVTQCHPLIEAGRNYLSLDSPDTPRYIELVLDREEDWSICDRGQKAKIPRFKDHVLCAVHIGEASFAIHHPFKTALMNFNPRLRTYPELLIEKYDAKRRPCVPCGRRRCHWEGHVAVLSAKPRIIEQMKRRCVSVEEYCALRQVAESEISI